MSDMEFFVKNCLQLQALNYFHKELRLRCFGGPEYASDNIRFINDVK